MAETIAVLSLKGGTGKTTTVRTLADVLRRVGLDVLTIDLDPQGNLSDYFDVPPDASPTIADVLSGDVKVKAAAHDGIVPATPILAEVERANARLQPVLVGTASIEKSEVLSEYLKKHGYKQIDFGNENAMEKLYAAARAGKSAILPSEGDSAGSTAEGRRK